MESFLKDLELYVSYTQAIWNLQGYWILIGTHFGIGFLAGLYLFLRSKKRNMTMLGFVCWLACCSSSVISPLLLIIVVPISLVAIAEASSRSVINGASEDR